MPAQQSKYRIAAGFILLSMAIASPIGFLVALPQGQLGITAFVGFVVAILDIIVALLLIPILYSGGKALARWAALLRILYSIGLLIATILLIVSKHAIVFNQTWDYSLGLFGLHLLIAGIAMCRARDLPTFIGLLLIIAGIGYVFDFVMAVAKIDVISLAAVTFIGEVALLIWLLWSGFQLRKQTA